VKNDESGVHDVNIDNTVVHDANGTVAGLPVEKKSQTMSEKKPNRVKKPRC